MTGQRYVRITVQGADGRPKRVIFDVERQKLAQVDTTWMTTYQIDLLCDQLERDSYFPEQETTA